MNSAKNLLYAFAPLLLGASLSVSPGNTMPPKVVQAQEFSVIGIEARTNNAREMTNAGIIPKQWSRFFAEGILSRIPNQVDPTIYALYTDYASDRNGDYTFLIGAKVSGTSTIPAGMVAKKVPAGKYAVVTSARGPVQSVVPQAWQQIWTLEDKSQLGGRRAYKADFEVYDQRSRDPQDSQVDIYVGLH
ncbi:MAG: GyrI-like domain-containing protein [Terriglobales bacterium]|jgi:predicted transcriptional regulator YdeE|nr:GyrI-like domain-containing protein [Terriglobales bacterium]